MCLDFIQYHYAAVGDYIFLIIIVLASIIQAYNQNRKKAEMKRAVLPEEIVNDEQAEGEQDDSPRKLPRNDSPFGSFLDQMEKMLVPDISEREQSGDENDIPEKKAVNRFGGSITRPSNITEDELNMEMQKNYTAFDTYKPSKELNPVKSKRRFREGFNMKKAVIYAEILNRKYS